MKHEIIETFDVTNIVYIQSYHIFYLPLVMSLYEK